MDTGPLLWEVVEEGPVAALPLLHGVGHPCLVLDGLYTAPAVSGSIGPTNSVEAVRRFSMLLFAGEPVFIALDLQ